MSEPRPRVVEVRRPDADAAPSRSLALRPRASGLAPATTVSVEESYDGGGRRGLPPLGPARLGRIIIEHLEQDGPVDERLVVLGDPRGAAAEAYRAAFYRLGATSTARVVMVTTSSEEEESSAAAANLALAMAAGGGEGVLLIETRFGPPRLAEVFGYRPSECFGRRLSKHRAEPDAPWRIAQLGETNLSLLCLDPRRDFAPALDAQALGEVVQSLADCGFGHIVVDAPAVTKDTDARFVAQCVDGAILALHAGQSHQRRLDRSLALLRGDGCPVLGYLLREG